MNRNGKACGRDHTTLLWRRGGGTLCLSLALALLLSSCVVPHRRWRYEAPIEVGSVELADASWGGWYRLEQSPRPADLYALAWQLARQHRHEEAVAELTAALRIAPGQSGFLEARGALYTTMGYLRAAEQDFERAAALEPERRSIWMALGRVKILLELPSAALDCLRTAEGLGEHRSELALLQARAHRLAGDLELAANRYVAAVELDLYPSVELRLEAACALQSLAARLSYDDHVLATKWVDDVLIEDPENTDAWLLSGMLSELGRTPDDPVLSYLRATELDPLNLDAWTNLALIAHDEGDRALCGDAASQALALEPTRRRRQALERLVPERTPVGRCRD